jgi:hypothetical protein
MELELERVNHKYQELDTFNLALDEVIIISSCFYEVIEEYHDGSPEYTRDFIEYNDALKYFDKIIKLNK